MRCVGFSLRWLLLLRSTGSRCVGSVVVAHRLSCSAACGIFPDQGSKPCPLHWQADSQPLRHQGSPPRILWPASWPDEQGCSSLRVPVLGGPRAPGAGSGRPAEHWPARTLRLSGCWRTWAACPAVVLLTPLTVLQLVAQLRLLLQAGERSPCALYGLELP